MATRSHGAPGSRRAMQHLPLTALGGELIRHVLAFLPIADRRSARLACHELRRAADDLVRTIAAGSAAGGVAAIESIAQLAPRCARWRHVAALELDVISASGDAAEQTAAGCAAMALLDGAVKHWPGLSRLRLSINSGGAALPLLLSAPRLGALTSLELEMRPDAELLSASLLAALPSLRALRLACMPHQPPLDLTPLSSLTRLTLLHLSAPQHRASRGFLPPSLRSLRVGGPNCGGAWLRAVGACGALEELELARVGAEDMGRWGDGGGGDWVEGDENGIPEGFIEFCSVVGGITSLKSLSGMLLLGDLGPIPARQLLPRLTRLTRLNLYRWGSIVFCMCRGGR
ncbi:MAG: hypothetical protein J3K34DRAFT_435848 [Monoraphidium minutum]|nr:MAG: hypothetical protein J3K34DRAFT_435848 [Monoraphidium minutum]